MTFRFVPSARASLSLSVALFISVLPLGCGLSGQSGDPGDMATVPEDECSVTSWPNVDAPRTEYSCERVGDEDLFRCECGDSQADAETPWCSHALQTACDVDADLEDHCSRENYGTCWPAEENGFECLCDTRDDLIPASGSSCDEALAATCIDQCADPTGTCTAPLGLAVEAENGGSTLGYACNCGDRFSDQAMTPTGDTSPTCARALAQTCGGSCESETGECVAAEAGYECHCQDGSDVAVESSISGPRCEETLMYNCGYVESAKTCSSRNGGASGSCTADRLVLLMNEPAPKTRNYTCTCQTGANVEEGTFEGTCGDAVESACPDAIRPEGTSPIALGDYGTSCESDAECEDGACYVPGTGVDAICSAACDDDSDCRSGSLCYEGYCFVSCTPDDDEACLLLNAAVENPLHCFDRAEIGSSGSICIQQSEP